MEAIPPVPPIDKAINRVIGLLDGIESKVLINIIERCNKLLSMNDANEAEIELKRIFKKLENFNIPGLVWDERKGEIILWEAGLVSQEDIRRPEQV